MHLFFKETYKLLCCQEIKTMHHNCFSYPKAYPPFPTLSANNKRTVPAGVDNVVDGVWDFYKKIEQLTP